MRIDQPSMQYTDEQKASFKQQFGVRRKRQFMLAIPVLALVVAFGLLADTDSTAGIAGIPLSVAGPPFLMLIVGAIVFSIRNWRCPACDRYLGKNIDPHYCPKCGVALQ